MRRLFIVYDTNNFERRHTTRFPEPLSSEIAFHDPYMEHIKRLAEEELRRAEKHGGDTRFPTWILEIATRALNEEVE